MTTSNDNRPTITIETRTAYGQERTYPVGVNADAVQALTGKKTLSWGDIDALSALGFRITTESTVQAEYVASMKKMVANHKATHGGFELVDEQQGEACGRCQQEDAGETEDLEGNLLCDDCAVDFVNEYNEEYC